MPPAVGTGQIAGQQIMPTKPMTKPDYFAAQGGLPPQTALMTGRAVFTEAYAVIPRGTMRDIVTSALPGWQGTRAWILARPLSGFAETFAQYVVELSPGGGCTRAEPDSGVEAALFVTGGTVRLTLPDGPVDLGPGGFAFVPAGIEWSVTNTGDEAACFHWLRKRFEPVPGLEPPDIVIASDKETSPVAMPDTAGVWATTRFIDPDDLRYDMHLNIVTFQPGGVIPFEETHVMEHGIFVLQGKGVYKLNRDWVEVEEGDFMWLRAFCPQACYAAGPGPFRYLLYKDVNRHPRLP